MDFSKMIEGISKAAEMSMPRKPDDYTDFDGFLICGNCHTRKQTEITINGEKHRVYCMCKCQEEAKEAEDRKRREARHKELIERMRDEAFETDNLKTWTVENADEDVADLMEIVKDYTEHFDEMKKGKRGLIFYGDVGVGKSYAAACIVNRLIDKGIRCKMTSVSAIVSEMESYKAERQAIIRELDDYDLLVLDDIGAERSSDYMQSKMFDIIDARAKSGKPLICTTNLSERDIKKERGLAGERIFSRILEMCVPVKVEGVNRRRTIAENDNNWIKRMFHWKGVS